MQTSEKITVAAVVYDKEYPLLLIQAKSIARYMRPDFVREIIWIVNHAPGEAQENTQFLCIAALHLIERGFSLRIVPRSAFGLEKYTSQNGGWRHQQALKLLVSGLVQTQHYMLMDCKNFLTRPIGSAELFRNGKAITFRKRCPENLTPWLLASAKALGAEVDAAERIMPTATPYVMHTSSVRELIAKTPQPFEEFFYSNPGVTEFFLYFCHLKKLGMVNELYVFITQFYATFFAKYPSDPVHIDLVRRNVDSQHVLCVSFHRDRFRACAPEFKEYIAQLWKRHELVLDQNEFDSVFGAMAAH